MIKVLICFLLVVLLIFCCGCASDQTDKYWKSKIETIIENDSSSLIEMWDICSKYQITGVTVSNDKKNNDTRFYYANFNNKKYMIVFDEETEIDDALKLKLDRLCEIYSSLQADYKIIDISCYNWDDSKYN